MDAAFVVPSLLRLSDSQQLTQRFDADRIQPHLQPLPEFGCEQCVVERVMGLLVFQPVAASQGGQIEFLLLMSSVFAILVLAQVQPSLYTRSVDCWLGQRFAAAVQFLAQRSEVDSDRKSV